MSEDFVSKSEFNALKEEVNIIKKEMAESNKILIAIDKKIDIIDAKIVTADKIDDLRLSPLEKRVGTLEETQKWLTRTVVGSVITIIAEVVVFAIKMM